MFLDYFKISVFNFFNKSVAILSLLILIQNCAEPENDDVVDDVPTYTNTLVSQSIGNGSTGAVDDYFYNFDDAIDAKFFKYSKSRFGTSYDKYITSYPYPPDNLIMKNFPDYLLDVSPDSNSAYGKYLIFLSRVVSL